MSAPTSERPAFKAFTDSEVAGVLAGELPPAARDYLATCSPEEAEAYLQSLVADLETEIQRQKLNLELASQLAKAIPEAEVWCGDTLLTSEGSPAEDQRIPRLPMNTRQTGDTQSLQATSHQTHPCLLYTSPSPRD